MIFGFNRQVFVRQERVKDGVVPTVRHGRGDVMVWGCFLGDTIGNLSKIQGAHNHHVYFDILCLMGPPFVFQATLELFDQKVLHQMTGSRQSSS